MRLLDCFADVIAYTLYLLEAVGSDVREANEEEPVVAGAVPGGAEAPAKSGGIPGLGTALLKGGPASPASTTPTSPTGGTFVGARSAMGKRKHRFSFQDVQDTYKRLFERSEKVLDNSSFQRDDYFLARFALCAWIDEKVLTSSWDEKQHWPTEELQRQFYKTTNAGEEFYDLLRKLTAEQTQVKEVFSVCMELGFQGRYFGRYGKEELDEIRKKVRTELLGSNPSPAALVAHGNKLFPQAYQKSRPSKKTDLSWLGNIAITLILMAISLLLVVGVYVWAVNDVSRQKSKLFPNLVSVPKDTSGSKSGSNSSD